MTNDANKTPEHDVWPPLPTFRPDIAKPARQSSLLWVGLAMNTGFGLISSGLRVWHFWQTHRQIVWWEVAYSGLIVFVAGAVGQIFLRYWSVRQSRNSNVP